MRKAPKKPARSFLAVARSLNLEGPRGWSRRLEEYLYGENSHAAE